MRNSFKYTKFYSGAEPVSGGEVSGEVGGEAVTVKLDINKLNALLEFYVEARTRIELQDYFRKNILTPLLKSKRIKWTIPDKPNSSKQKIYKGVKSLFIHASVL